MQRTFDPMQLGSIELFCQAATLGSFTAAAQQAGVTPAAVSRSVSRLEARLGVRLFVRSTRQIRLTVEGQLYHEHCLQALAQIAEAGRLVTGQQAAPSGVLRISAPTTYAHHRLFPLLPRFAEAFPEVRLEVSVSNRNVDLVEDGFDLAIRAGTPPDSNLVIRPLESLSLGVFAAPAYLRRHGRPRTPQDLNDHDCIQFILPSTGRPLPWLFRSRQGEDEEHLPEGRVKVLGDVLGCLHLAQAGGGIAQAFHVIADKAVRSGELVELLKPYAGRTRAFSILYPRNRHLAARVRAFVDFLLAARSGGM